MLLIQLQCQSQNAAILDCVENAVRAMGVGRRRPHCTLNIRGTAEHDNCSGRHFFTQATTKRTPSKRDYTGTSHVNQLQRKLQRHFGKQEERRTRSGGSSLKAGIRRSLSHLGLEGSSISSTSFSGRKRRLLFL